jgi:hypothetical protein
MTAYTACAVAGEHRVTCTTSDPISCILAPCRRTVLFAGFAAAQDANYTKANNNTKSHKDYVSSRNLVSANPYSLRQTRRFMVTTVAAIIMVAASSRSKLP